MCARFSLSASDEEIQAAYAAELAEPFTPTNNITITNECLVITADEPGRLQKMHFQLVPYFAPSIKGIGRNTFNTRNDNIIDSKLWGPLFRKGKRVLILADKFYEKDKLVDPDENQDYAFKLNDRDLFAFAGLWSKWTPKDPEQAPYYSFSIITADSNETVGQYHDKQRMPVILPNKDAESLWLNKDAQEDDLLQLLKPYPDELMYAYPVPRFTKKPQTDRLDSENSL